MEAYARRAEGPTIHLDLPLDGLEEDAVWSQLEKQSPAHRATDQARKVARYAFTELLNNAIDHSGGTRVRIDWRPGSITVEASIEDDGIGAFERIRATLDLPDHLTALEEVSKGKLTTQSDRHSGEGLFFTSKAVDLFDLRANGLRWIVDNRRQDVAFGQTEPHRGTAVRFEVDAMSTRRLEDLFAEYTDEEYRFNRSRGIVKLFHHGSSFVSRSEAKRLMTGMERFRALDVDFAGVESVGQGFADEVFRVWATEHPDVRLSPINTNPAVSLMVERARTASGSAPNSGGSRPEST